MTGLKRGRGRRGGLFPGLTEHLINSANQAAKQAITPDAIIGITKNIIGRAPGLITKAISKIRGKGQRIQRGCGVVTTCNWIYITQAGKPTTSMSPKLETSYTHKM